MDSNPASLTPIVQVLLPLPLTDSYDYLPLEGQNLPAGTVVQVPLGSRQVTGVVWGEGLSDLPLQKLRPILAVDPVPPLPDDIRRFVDWVADYTVAARGAVLKMVFGSMDIIHAKKNDHYTAENLCTDSRVPSLSDEQRQAVDVLVGQLDKHDFSVTLLDGVTGSGKTEVFGEAIASALRQGKQVLLMLPEIAMTAALMDRLTARFGARPTEWHSELTPKQRRINWHAIMRGKAQFVVGARSALFLPYAKLGLIVVDEEHEAAYKQEEGVIYHGRDMAVVRARIGKIPVVLSSATPSLETLHNVQQGKYTCVALRQRYGKASMPHIKLVDMRQEKLLAREFITQPVVDQLKNTLAEKQQAMLFLNRRGYAPLTLCRACGHRLQCPRCTSWLIEHRHTGRLECHHCEYTAQLPPKCPSCGAADKFAACGPGVERVAEEIQRRMPDARVAIMVSDMLDGPKAAQQMVDQMAGHQLDILVGTQIMAKGYHFPRLTFVGVIDADLGLAGGDPRAAERTFQLLQQMAGRSGRARDAGHVLLQTTMPDNPVMQALVKGDRDAFMAAELAEREAYQLPPFWRLASLTLAGTDQKQVEAWAAKLASLAPQDPRIKILGPAPATFAMLRGRYRYRLMVQAPRNINVSKLVRDWIGAVPLPRTIRLAVDVDPYSFL